MPDVELDVIIDAPVQIVWNVLFDWQRQGEWMLGTHVKVASGDGASVGSVVEAFSGVGKAGFLDTMVVTHWDPPRRCDVLHTGDIVKGTGTFELLELPSGRTRFVWGESLELPWGVVGRLGWPIARPAFLLGIRQSLNKLAAVAEADARR